MTEDDQMHWDYIVKCNSDVPAIQAADADMKAFRAKLDREKLVDVIGRNISDEPDETDLLYCAEAIISYFKEYK